MNVWLYSLVSQRLSGCMAAWPNGCVAVLLCDFYGCGYMTVILLLCDSISVAVWLRLHGFGCISVAEWLCVCMVVWLQGCVAIWQCGCICCFTTNTARISI